jgi:hypothetical protein
MLGLQIKNKYRANEFIFHKVISHYQDDPLNTQLPFFNHNEQSLPT